jgi:hypothetical protein
MRIRVKRMLGEDVIQGDLALWGDELDAGGARVAVHHWVHPDGTVESSGLSVDWQAGSLRVSTTVR